MKRFRGLLVSLPWADYASPSVQVGSVASYARKKGFDVRARHLHLQAALSFGLDGYYSLMNECGDALSAALLFPERRNLIIELIKSNGMEVSSQLFNKFRRMMLGIFKSIDWSKYSVVGFTTDLNQLFSALFIAKILKSEYPDINVVFGGYCASRDLGQSILKCFEQVDYCIDGEGEIPFSRLLELLSSSKKVSCADVPGLIYRENGSVSINPRQQLNNLDDLPDPDYENYFDIIENHPYLKNHCIESFVPIEGGRGCTHKCAFCGARLQMDGYRSKTFKRIAQQLSRISRRYRTINFRFTDLRTHPQKDVALFKLILRQGKDYNLYYDIRADVDKTILASMKSAGVRNVLIGIEALSTTLLNKMKKGSRVIDNLQVMKYCEELGIHHSSNLILDFPTETKRDISEAIRNMDFALPFQPPTLLVKFMLLAGSVVEQMRSQYGISHVRNDKFKSKFVPAKVERDLLFSVKSYRKRSKNDYRVFRKAYERWENCYYEARKKGKRLLSYWDGGGFIQIVDLRQGRSSIMLEDNTRELYLYCDSIKSMKQIIDQFPEWKAADLKSVLKQLVDLKLMYREGDDYLSLAVRNMTTQPFRA